MSSYAANELMEARFGDERLNKRLIKIIENLSENPTKSIPEACQTWGETRAIYRFWDNRKVTPELILEPHIAKTVERVKSESVVLAIQDTSDADFTKHLKTKGLGYLDTIYLQGIKIHTTLAVSAKGVPLGILHQQQWTRANEEIGKKHTRTKRPTADKESNRWIDSHNAVNELIPASTQVIHIGDRESDIYDLFASVRKESEFLLIRCAQNRRLKDEPICLKEAVALQKPVGTMTVKQKRPQDNVSKEVECGLRSLKAEILPPATRKDSKTLPSVKVTIIEVKENNAADKKEPIHWILLTTLPVETEEDIKAYVKYYSYRWLIERYHYTLKSGCQIEELQLETAERLKNAIATYCIVAWRILWMLYLSREDGNLPYNLIMSDVEMEILYFKFNPKAKSLPEQPPAISEVIRWIARLGGFLGRKSDGNPGVKTLWRGLVRLEVMAQTWSFAKSYFTNCQRTYG